MQYRVRTVTCRVHRGRLMANLASMPLPRTPTRHRRTTPLTKLRLALMLFALLAVIGLTVDLVSLRLRAERAIKSNGLSSLVAETLIEVSTSSNRWVEPAGRFSIKQPPGWSVVTSPGGTYDATLRGPYRLEINVAVRPAEPGGMEALHQRLQGIESNLNLTTRLEPDQFLGRPAWRRTMPLQKSAVEAMDVIVGGQAVHVLMAAPAETFGDFRPVLVEVRDSLVVEGGS